ncbi:hypothetical protein ACFXO9_02170 [Nocardia tengchongensis]|uniref:hypothetical protein n=1 Tax=Nocardia tengchongensis TaxID=2055889 RepID=UPI0036AE24CE
MASAAARHPATGADRVEATNSPIHGSTASRTGMLLGRKSIGCQQISGALLLVELAKVTAADIAARFDVAADA